MPIKTDFPPIRNIPEVYFTEGRFKHMAERQNYNTKARKYILDFLQSRQDSTVSAADITVHLNNMGAAVNQATVYRYLNRLSRENRVLKFTDSKTKKSVYRFVGEDRGCDGHIHTKCVSCGRLMHVECDFMEDIKNLLAEDHGFLLQCDGSILSGVCEECQKK